MSQQPGISPFVHALDGDDGTKKPTDEDGYVTLATDTYYFPIGAHVSELVGIQIVTDASIAGTFTIETSIFPNEGVGGLSDWAEDSDNAGKWVQCNPSTALVDSTGTGWSITALTLAKTAGLGGAMIHMGNLGAKRVRVKAVISTAGRCAVLRQGKS